MLIIGPVSPLSARQACHRCSFNVGVDEPFILVTTEVFGRGRKPFLDGEASQWSAFAGPIFSALPACDRGPCATIASPSTLGTLPSPSLAASGSIVGPSYNGVGVGWAWCAGLLVRVRPQERINCSSLIIFVDVLNQLIRGSTPYSSSVLYFPPNVMPGAANAFRSCLRLQQSILPMPST
jgi:hypothetical protein